jgi:hypothetical protein
MKIIKPLVTLILVFTLLAAQVGVVLADGPITGTVQSITIEKDPITGMTTVLVALQENGASQVARINLSTAASLGLVTLDANGNPVINNSALGKPINIDSKFVITEEQDLQHPVGSALASFFSDIAGLDYDAIMTAHEDGTGFGVIAQALWLTLKLEGGSDTFLEILEAKKTGDFSAFKLEDGTTPKNWGQFKKAILDGEKGNLGIVMSGNNKDKNKNDNADTPDKGIGPQNGKKDKNKDKGNGKNK